MPQHLEQGMAGTLFHGCAFEKNEYVGRDGHTHYELQPLDGDLEVVSNRSWSEIQDYCQDMGIPRSAWPTYESAADVPLDDVREKNARLSKLLLALSPGDASRCFWLEKIIAYCRNDELFFFVIE